MKDKRDINYKKFVEFSKDLEDKTELYIIAKTNLIFNKPNILKFSKAIETNPKKKVRFNFKIKKAGQFIDIDTYRNEGDIERFIKSLLKLTPFYKFKYYNRLSLWDVECLVNEYNQFKSKIVDQYEYIFNPPIRVGNGEVTQGNIERQAFFEHYGGYIELMYAVSKGDSTKWESISKWDLHKFLFIGEYLLRKRDVENIK